ncbi:MAG: 4-hydroxy-3-methylbut-2-enyl diphosphate reductase [Desulfobacteraceae bacterium]|nr:MAG: 4-hydroxy-3-methylbut-2-enyl diphosphate reductase [Desulfobacteraceae bacterium]
MKVKLAKTAGFCMGVRRAIEQVLNTANKSPEPIFTFGPIIHNTQVIELLESKGVRVCEDIRKLQNRTTVIRAHGIPPGQRKDLKQVNARIIDATCPHVARVQALIRYHTHKGALAVIVGDRGHPEVIGLVGYGNDRVQVINQKQEIASLPEAEKVIVVAQTTQDEQHFQDLVRALQIKYPGLQVFNTICNATRDRQNEIRSFAGQVDGLVVVGGYHSGNTRRLVQIAEAAGLKVFQVETEEELDTRALSGMEVIGVTAGASTPNWMIKKVVHRLESIKGKREMAVRRPFLQVIKFLFLSNIMVALGAWSLGFAGLALSGQPPEWLRPLLALCYIFAMHVLNRFLDKGASTYNDPERALFYCRFRAALILSGIFAGLAALVIAYFLDLKTLLAMLGLSILGILYSVPIVPVWFKRFWPYRRIKDIPGSKTFSEALAWSAVITLLPQLEPRAPVWSSTAIAFLVVFALVFIRSGLFEIFEAQGDRIVGIETLPIVLGEKKALNLFKTILLLTVLVLIFAPFLLHRWFASLLILPFGLLYVSMLAYEKRWIYPGLTLEALVEAALLLAGLLTAFYHFLP